MATVYVRLLDEGVDVWRPAEAKRLPGDVYRIVGEIRAGERWEFSPGSIVRCRQRSFEGGADLCLAAYEQVN